MGKIKRPNVEPAPLNQIAFAKGARERHCFRPHTHCRMVARFIVIRLSGWRHSPGWDNGKAQVIALGNGDGVSKGDSMLTRDERQHVAALTALVIVPEAAFTAVTTDRERSAATVTQFSCRDG
jgi:hypothetical protein